MKKMLFLTIFLIMLASCTGPQSPSPTSTALPQANLPNPASVYCQEQGFQSEIHTTTDGSQTGICRFPGGSACDEWAYYRGDCGPVPQQDVDSFTDEIASDGCKVYRNETLGYSFHYPGDAQIVANDDPLKSISVEGSLVEGEHWPQFTISHPSNREAYHPPEDVDLVQWLTEHNLLTDDRLADVQIAGIPAIHLHHDRSPQSYADDRYFFAKSGQLYMIVIGHAGDKEDWDLYNHFLESFQFETN